MQVSPRVQATARMRVQTAESSRTWATQGHRDYTVAGIKICTKCGRKVIFREGVDGEAMVGDVIKGDRASLIV